MYKGKKILALIPARGNSKGLPGKNIRLLLGKPLITWSIRQALASRYLDRVVVSTDNPMIARIARDSGAQVPFLRPRRLATDTATSIDVIIHAVEFLGRKRELFDYLLLLEPTSPLREVADIDRCIELLDGRPDAESVVSVSRLESGHPEFNLVIAPRTGFIKRFLRARSAASRFQSLRRQDIPDVYFFDGTIYLSRVGSLLLRRTFYHERTLPFVVPRWKSLEIDELPDLIAAESLLKARLSGVF